MDRQRQRATSKLLLSRLKAENLLKMSRDMRLAFQRDIKLEDVPKPIKYKPGPSHTLKDLKSHGQLTSPSSISISKCSLVHRPKTSGIPTCNFFDPSRTSEKVTLSFSNKEAHMAETPDGEEDYYAAVDGAGAYSTGQVSFSIKILSDTGCIFVGVTSPDIRAQGVNLLTERKFRGWTNASHLYDHTTGGELCQGWKKGDTIALLLDCSEHRMTATHSRSEKSSTVYVPPGFLCFRVQLENGAAVRIV